MNVKIACIQTNTSDDMVENLRIIGEQVREAAGQGAKFIALPENAFLMALGEKFHGQVYTPKTHPALQAVQAWAATLDVWVLIGSVAVKQGTEGGQKADSALSVSEANSPCDFQEKITGQKNRYLSHGERSQNAQRDAGEGEEIIPRETLEFARELRRNQTSAEALMWGLLRDRRLGFKFRRQHPLPPYIADFCCVEQKLIVELDGSQHTEDAAMQSDEARTQFLQARGYQVLRFWNNDVLQRTENVLTAIYAALHPHPKSEISTSPNGRGEKYLNRSYLISPTGINAYYDKIHLFDVSVPNGESHQESARFDAGEKAVIAHTPWGKLGMTICYDVRFPHLYRTLAKAGAEMLATPAAFTRFTGEKGGWHILNRARAMETGCFVLAPAQCGTHAGGRKTYGHSLIINPWGDILAEAADEPCILMAEIDLAEVAQTRAIMPSLQHDRAFDIG